MIEKTDRLTLATQVKVKRPKLLEAFFEEAILNGCEGIVCKLQETNRSIRLAVEAGFG